MQESKQEKKMNELKQACETVAEILNRELRKSLDRKGRNMTMELSNSIDVYVREIANGLYIYGEFFDYGAAQDQGIKPDRIPLFPGSGNKKSKYIEGLIKFARIKLGIAEEKKQRQAAFAIAHVHKKVGMHSRNSLSAPSEAGWMSDTLANLEPMIEKIISEGTAKEFEALIDNLIKQAA